MPGRVRQRVGRGRLRVRQGGQPRVATSGRVDVVSGRRCLPTGRVRRPCRAGSASRRAGRAVVAGGVYVASARVGRRARQCQSRVSQGGPSCQAGLALCRAGGIGCVGRGGSSCRAGSKSRQARVALCQAGSVDASGRVGLAPGRAGSRVGQGGRQGCCRGGRWPCARGGNPRGGNHRGGSSRGGSSRGGSSHGGTSRGGSSHGGNSRGILNMLALILTILGLILAILSLVLDLNWVRRNARNV